MCDAFFSLLNVPFLDGGMCWEGQNEKVKDKKANWRSPYFLLFWVHEMREKNMDMYHLHE